MSLVGIDCAIQSQDRPRRVQMALSGMLRFGVAARDVFCRSARRRVSHGGRSTDGVEPAAVPEAAAVAMLVTWPAGAIASEAGTEDSEYPRQLWLFGYRVMCRHVGESGEVYYPDLPDDYPERRPHTFAYCQSLGLGTKVPCAFATCRHSLLADEIAGELHPDADPWEVETCSLALAGRRRLDNHEIVSIAGWVEPTIEEWQRRGQVALLRGLGCGEYVALNKHGLARLRRPKLRAAELKTATIDGIAKLVAALPERPNIVAPPVKRYTAEEAAALYGAARVSRQYGTPAPSHATTSP